MVHWGRVERYQTVFVDPTDLTLLRSEMHLTPEAAIAAGKREHSPFLVLELRQSSDGYYTWVVMPHGYHKEWSFMQTLYDRRWQVGIGAATGLLVGLILFAGPETPKGSGKAA